jgi:hypothetical protein
MSEESRALGRRRNPKYYCVCIVNAVMLPRTCHLFLHMRMLSCCRKIPPFITCRSIGEYIIGELHRTTIYGPRYSSRESKSLHVAGKPCHQELVHVDEGESATIRWCLLETFHGARRCHSQLRLIALSVKS